MAEVKEWFRDVRLTIQLSSPPFVRRLILPRMHDLKEFVRLAVSPHLPVTLLSGIGHGGQITATFINVGFRTPFLKNMLFVEEPTTTQLEPIPFWRYRDIADSTQSDLIVFEATRHITGRLAHRNAFELPEYIEHVLDVTGDWQKIRDRFRHGLRRKVVDRLTKVGYEYETSHSDREFKEFYYQMYLPTMNNRHGRLTSAMSYREAHLYFRRGLLIQVKQQGDWIAGVVCSPEGDSLVSYIEGVKNGDPQLVSENVEYTTYIGSIRWANEHGFRFMNFQGTEPLLAAGLFQHKRKWGGTVILPPTLHRRLWLKIQRFTPAVGHFLKTNPFITVDAKGTLQGVIVVENSEDILPETRQTWESQYATPGVSSLIVRSIKSFEQPEYRDLVIPATAVSQVQN